MKKYELSDFVYSELKKIFKSAACELDFKNDYELMVAVVLSAQCTDKRVNSVTPSLFAKYPTFLSLSNANIQDVEEIIKPCGFYHNKAKNIIEASKQICQNYNSHIHILFRLHNHSFHQVFHIDDRLLDYLYR